MPFPDGRGSVPRVLEVGSAPRAGPPSPPAPAAAPAPALTLAVATRGLTVAVVTVEPVVTAPPTLIAVAPWGRLEEGALFA